MKQDSSIHSKQSQKCASTDFISSRGRNYFYLWALGIAFAHLLLWTLPAIYWRSALPLDTTEGFAYSLHWQWGYIRDPYLVSLMMKVGRWLANDQTWIFYFFSQFAVLASFLAVWRLARALGLSAALALISVLCLEGVAFYNYSTPEFNDNVLILPFWAWSGYFFYQATRMATLRHWLLLGLFAGLTTMAKHSGGILVLSMLVYLLFSPAGRRHWSQPGVYIGSLVAFLIILPNIIWLFEQDFSTLIYANDRAALSSTVSWYSHLLNPLKFVSEQALIVAPALLLLLSVGTGSKSINALPLSHDQRFCLFSIAVLPWILMVLFSAVSGGTIQDYWGAPLYLLLGVVVLTKWPPQLQLRNWRRFTAGAVLVFNLMLLVYITELLWKPTFEQFPRETFPGNRVAAEAETLWTSRFPDFPLCYVDGDRWITGNLSVFDAAHPLALPYFNSKFSRRGSSLNGSQKEIDRRGIMLVWFSSDTALAAQYPSAVPLGRIPVRYARAQQHAPEYITVAAIPPLTRENTASLR